MHADATSSPAHRSDAGAPFDRAPADSTRAHLWWLLGLTLLALAIRMTRLDHQAFWTDEVESLKLMTKPGVNPWQMLRDNFHGPLHKALLWAWCSVFGITETGARSLSAVIGAGTVPLVFFAARRWLGTSTALWAAFLLAINPFHVYYSQEVRGYVLLMALAVVTVWMFLRDERLRTWRTALAFVLSSIAIALSSFGGLFVVAAMGLLALIAAWRRRYSIWRFAGMIVVVLVALVPYFAEFGTTVDPDAIVGLGNKADERPLRGSHTFSPLAPMHSMYAYSVGLTLGPSINEMHQSLSFGTFRPHLFALAASAITFGVVALLGLFRSRLRPERFGFLVAWFVVPILLTAALAFLNVKVYNVRYPSAGFVPWVIFLALGLSALPSTARWVAATIIVGLSGWSIRNLYAVDAYMRPDARSAAELILREGRPNDKILIYSIREPFDYYYTWRGEGPNSVDLLHGHVFWNEQAFREFLEEYTNCDERIWLVRWRSWYMDPADKSKATFDKNLAHAGSWRFTDLPVDLYECGDGTIGAVMR